MQNIEYLFSFLTCMHNKAKNMNCSPFFSIIVPVYKAEHYLTHCIDSILTQTYPNFELLLINDGSPDNSGKICDEYALKDSRIRVFHKKNEGVSSARNTGLENINGKWIAFIDSDDWVEKDWLESYVKSIEKQNYDIVFQGYTCEYPQYSQKHFLQNSPTDYIESIFCLEKNDLFGWTWNKAFQASVIQKHNIRFNPLLNVNEDLLFTLLFCSYAQSISILPSTKYHYIIHNESLMCSPRTYQELSIKSNLIKEARMKLINKNQEHHQYTTWIQEQYNIDILQSFKILYKTYPLPPFKERKNQFMSLRNIQYYPSSNPIKKLLLKIFQYLPFIIVDYMAKIFFRLYYNNINNRLY